MEVNESAQNRGQRETDEWLYDDEWLYSSDDKDDDVRDLNTLRALHRMDLSGIGTGEDVGTKTGNCSRQQETPVQRGDILQDQDARIVQTKQRETANEAAQVATDDAAQAAAIAMFAAKDIKVSEVLKQKNPKCLRFLDYKNSESSKFQVPKFRNRIL